MIRTISCPCSSEQQDCITLAHGSGGKETARLIETIFRPAFTNDLLDPLHDGAVLPCPKGPLVFTTDSYVIQPLFFPGGDIGTLAVTGTINDLAMCGAKPLYLSCSFIIEEGLPIATLQRVVGSMAACATAQAVKIVTGDTKVIERHSGTNLFITTSGIGERCTKHTIHAEAIRPGDAIIVSGDIGRHGMAVMAERESLSFTEKLVSDCASLSPMIQELIQQDVSLHCLRDATRGGLATTLVELSEASGLNCHIHEERIPVSQSVTSACEILGLDPLYVANEGCCVLFIPEHEAQHALSIVRHFPEGVSASIIGTVAGFCDRPRVTLKSTFGTERFLQKLIGDQLPRIC